MSKLDKIATSFHYTCSADLYKSIFPSMKYHFTEFIVLYSLTLTSVADLLGMKTATVMAFVVLTCFELVTGIYASLRIKKEKLKSAKLSRFTIKLAAIVVILYVLNAFSQEYVGKSSLAEEFWGWLYNVAMIYFGFEYLISVLENISVITGESTNALIKAIRGKVNKILDINPENEGA